METSTASFEIAARRGLAAIAALLVGLGIVFWVAANWDDLGRFGKFALLQGVVVTMGVAAWRTRDAGRAAFAVLTLFAIGGLFAFFGQTYQTGADPWQLFALWALLSLPLAWGARNDIVYLPWTLVAMVAISLWSHAYAGHQWIFELRALSVHLAAWSAAAAIVLLLSPPWRRFTHAGRWSFRFALLLMTVLVAVAAIGALFATHPAPQYWCGLVVLGIVGCVLASERGFDMAALSGIALALNVLLVAGVIRLVFNGASRDLTGLVFVVGLTAAGLLAATVTLLMHVQRRHGVREAL